jgi:purine-cytosine permease-like protein
VDTAPDRVSTLDTRVPPAGSVAGHNLVHVFERYAFPVLAVAFLLATVFTLSKVDTSAAKGGGGIGGFLLTVGANVLNIYSGAMSFLAVGIRLPLNLRRAIVAIVFGVIGFLLAWSGLHDAGEKYENFLLVISYWIGPWLGVYFTDWYLRRNDRVDGFLFDRKHNPWG